MIKGMSRRILAVAAAAAMAVTGAMTLSGTANAAGTIVTDPKVTFTFNGSSDQLGHAELTAYKIADFVQYGTKPDVKYGVQTTQDNKTPVENALKSATAGTGTAYDPKADGDAMSWALAHNPAILDQDDANWGYAHGAASSTVRKFANALTGLTSPAAQPDDFKENKTGDKITSLTVDLEPGVYVFTDGSDATNKITVSVPMILSSGTIANNAVTDPAGDEYTTVNIKSTEFTDKTKHVTETSASIGDTLHYTLQGTIGNASTTEFRFTDTPGVGLTVNLPESADDAAAKDFTVTAYDGVDGQGNPTGTGTTLTFGTGYTITNNLRGGNKGGNLDGGSAGTFTVNILNPGSLAGKTIVVAYTATVNDEAQVDENGGNVVNTLDNNGTPVSVTTPLYAFRFTKKNPEGQPLQGAEFNVQDDGTTLSFVKQTDGSYRKAAPGEATTTSTLVSGDDGLIVVTGLGEGDYTVKETKQPDGYQRILPEFTIHIAADGDKTITADGWGLAGQDADTAEISVLNVRNITQLPLTGAAGTMLFTVLGLLIAGAGALVYAKSRSIRKAMH